jgi:hypothetical protein
MTTDDFLFQPTMHRYTPKQQGGSAKRRADRIGIEIEIVPACGAAWKRGLVPLIQPPYQHRQRKAQPPHMCAAQPTRVADGAAKQAENTCMGELIPGWRYQTHGVWLRTPIEEAQRTVATWASNRNTLCNPRIETSLVNTHTPLTETPPTNCDGLLRPA